MSAHVFIVTMGESHEGYEIEGVYESYASAIVRADALRQTKGKAWEKVDGEDEWFSGVDEIAIRRVEVFA